MENQSSRFRSFLARKQIEISLKRYFVDAMGAMAFGLFASLLIGTIFDAIADQTGWAFLAQASEFCSAATGPAMAVAIGYALQAPSLVLFCLCAVGAAANSLGGPLGTLFAAIVAAELGKAVSKETKVDILVTPTVTILFGCAVAALVGPGVSAIMYGFGALVMRATEMQPFFMGILVSVIVGMVLTLPISSAALCTMLGLTGLAGGAATAGCCAQMIGFAVISFRENRWGGLMAQGIGTSMLQVSNIVKNPRIWIAPTLASAITGPLATCVFKLQMNGAPISSGMSTCGLVGQIGVYSGWVSDIAAGAKAAITPMDWIGLLLLCFILPALLSWVINLGLRKLGWVKDGDMKLDV